MTATQEPFAAARPQAVNGTILATMPAFRGVVPSLNGLRAFSMTIVFLSHTVNEKLFPGGFGVRVFFLISGFLITRLMFVEWKAKGAIALGNFYIRRFLRLYPIIVLYTVVVVALFIAFRPGEIRWIEPLSALVYLANYYYSYLSQGGQIGGSMPFGNLWSLSVEEHFYLFFPLLFVGLRADPRRLAKACLVVIAASLALRTAVALADPDLVPTLTFYYQTQYQLDSIGFGVLIAALCEFETGQALLKRLFSPAAIGLAIVFLVAGLAIRNGFFRETLRYSILSAAILIAVVNILFSERFGLAQAVLNWGPIDWIGRLSYSIYVWHFLAHSMIHPGGGRLVTFVVWVVATLVMASASYYVVEQPLSRLRHRFGSVVPRRALN